MDIKGSQAEWEKLYKQTRQRKQLTGKEGEIFIVNRKYIYFKILITNHQREGCYENQQRHNEGDQYIQDPVC